MDKQIFYAELRKPQNGIFTGSLTDEQVTGMEVLLDEGEKMLNDVHHMANVLAQVARETGRRMAPVRETFADSDKQAIARLDAAFAKGQLSWVTTPYWRAGLFGRGQIQLSHEINYRRMGAVLGVDLVGQPDLALEPEISAKIAVMGMREGMFTGRRLADFRFPEDLDAPVSRNPRRIVNGRDGSDAQVAAYHHGFFRALTSAGWKTAPGEAFTPTLRRGNTARSEAVAQLQTDLASLRYFAGKIDGLFGRLTEDAVRSFQSDNRLTADGIVGPKTWAALKDAEPRPTRDVSVSDLRAAGSRTIAAADRQRGAGAVVSAGGGVLTYLNAANDAGAAVASAEGWLETAQGILLTYWPVLGVVAVGLAIWYFADQAAAARVDDARNGANMKR